MQVYKPGTDTLLKETGKHITVLSVSIGLNDVVRYEILWWNNSNERKTEWVSEIELSHYRDGRQRMTNIGFHNEP